MATPNTGFTIPQRTIVPTATGLQIGNTTSATQNNAIVPTTQKNTINSVIRGGDLQKMQAALGALRGAPNPLNLISTDVTGTSSGGSGTGGYVSGQNALIEAKRQASLDAINRRYEDLLAGYNESEAAAQASATSAREQIGKEKEIGTAQAEQTRQIGQRQLRQNRADAETNARRAARALGAGSSSGVLETYAQLDQQFTQNLSDLDTTVDAQIQKIDLTAQDALNTIETNLNGVINDINADRRASLRDKEDAIVEAQLAAEEAKLAVVKWAASRSGGSSSVSQTAIKNQVTADLFASRAANPGREDEVLAAFQPQILQAGGIGLLTDIQEALTPAAATNPLDNIPSAILSAGISQGALDPVQLLSLYGINVQ